MIDNKNNLSSASFITITEGKKWDSQVGENGLSGIYFPPNAQCLLRVKIRLLTPCCETPLMPKKRKKVNPYRVNSLCGGLYCLCIQQRPRLRS